MAEFQNYEQAAKEVAEKVLDAFLIEGKTLREWIRIIGEQEPKTRFVEKSNFDIEQYKTDLQSAYDCGKASQEPKTGHWERVKYDGNCGNWHCSECRTIIPHMPEGTDNTPIYKWCPNCGARMEV